MSDNEHIVGEANIKKYKDLLASESDLKSKLQQLFLKKKTDEAALNKKITTLEASLEKQIEATKQSKVDLTDLQGNIKQLEKELKSLTERFQSTYNNLKSCQKAYIAVDGKYKQIQSINAENEAASQAVSQNASKETTKSTTKTLKNSGQVRRVNSRPVKHDLKKIQGIGPKIMSVLYKNGITSFQQIANWTEKDVEQLNEKLYFYGRISRDQWIEQAKALVKTSS